MTSRKDNQEQWIDVSVPLRSGMVVWPGDPPVRIEKAFDIDHGDECNMSKVSMGTHSGTHMDAPLHYIKGGKGLDDMPFDASIGPARVIEIRDEESIKVEELIPHGICQGERILLKTRNSSRCWDKDVFFEDFVHISQKAAEFLIDRRARTVGIDYLSVGGFNPEGSRTHFTLLEAGIWVIEGLNLSALEPGNYHLICLPLKMLKSDGAPARAIVKKVF